MNLFYSFRSKLVSLFWRVTCPGHPRGWIEVNAELPAPDTTGTIFTKGLDRFSLPELLIADCPPDATLAGFCHGALFVAIGALQASEQAGRPIDADQVINLNTDQDDQPFGFRMVVDPDRPDTMRLVDIEPFGPTAFPAAAMAAYIANSAENMRPLPAARALELAIAVHARDYDFNDPRPASDDEWKQTYKTNAYAYFLMSDALSALGQIEGALDALKEGVARAPYAAEQMQREGFADSPDVNHPPEMTDFWRRMDPWQVEAEFRSRVS